MIDLELDGRYVVDLERLVLAEPAFERMEVGTDCPYASAVEYGTPPTNTPISDKKHMELVMWALRKFPDLPIDRRRAIVASAERHLMRTGMPPVSFMGTALDKMVGPRFEDCFDNRRAGTKDVARRLRTDMHNRLDRDIISGDGVDRTLPTSVKPDRVLRNSIVITDSKGVEVK